jgi:Lysylphosphatidylglycerol synthase TM region
VVGRGALYPCPVFLATEFVESAGESITDSLAGVHGGWLLAAIVAHTGGQLCRGLAWRGVLGASWPGVTRRRVCSWHLCGAGLSGILSGAGGDAVRVALAKRELSGATWPALAGTLVAESSFELVSGLGLVLVAISLGAAKLGASDVLPVGAVLAALAVAAVFARSRAARRIVLEVGRGMSVMRHPRLFLGDVLPWQVTGRLLRLAAIGCFLRAFGLPAGPAVIIAASVVVGSGNMLPFGGGAAAAAAALLVALPAAAGHPVDGDAIAALALVRPAVLTVVGSAMSLALLSMIFGVRTPRGLLRAARSLAPQGAIAPP